MLPLHIFNFRIPGVDGKDLAKSGISFSFATNCSLNASTFCWSLTGSTFSFSASTCCCLSNSTVSRPVNDRDLLWTCLINWAWTSGGSSRCLLPVSELVLWCKANSSGGISGSFFLDLRLESLMAVITVFGNDCWLAELDNQGSWDAGFTRWTNCLNKKYNVGQFEYLTKWNVIFPWL